MEERVQKIIANTGFCSRRRAEELIEQGRVKVNSKTISLGDKADINRDTIFVNGKEIKKQKKLYLMLNKPKGFLTSKDDPSGKPTIFELDSLIKYKNKVFPVGRLDFMTEGVLLLTNDGDFANKIAHPRYETKKTYKIVVDKPFFDRDLKRLEEGIIINGKKTSPARAKQITEREIELTIHEGRNRIVRHLMEKMHYKILFLKRIQIENYKLGNLKEGEVKEFTPELKNKN